MRTKLELLRAKDVAPMLGVSTRRVLQLVQEGRLPAVRTGRAVRFPRLAVETCFKQWSEQALGDMARTPPPVQADQPLASAIHELAGASPFGWTGTATELLERLGRHGDDDDGSARWPLNGRSLAIALRRLVPNLRGNGVLVVMGRRGHRGMRLISISEVGSGPAETRLSAASHGCRGAAASYAVRRSSRARGDAGGGAFTGVLTVDAELLDRTTAEERAWAGSRATPEAEVKVDEVGQRGES